MYIDYYNGNEWKSVSMDSVIKFKLNKDDYLYLYNHKEKFYHFGLQWIFTDNEILIHAIPTAILGKNIRDVSIMSKYSACVKISQHIFFLRSVYPPLFDKKICRIVIQ